MYSLGRDEAPEFLLTFISSKELTSALVGLIIG
jgi:hypothetical protein